MRKNAAEALKGLKPLLRKGAACIVRQGGKKRRGHVGKKKGEFRASICFLGKKNPQDPQKEERK